MASFRTRIKKISKEKGRIILANDFSNRSGDLEDKTLKIIKKLNPFLCGIKFNFHLLLPLGIKELIRINKLAHQYDLQTIADIKLNDIGNTNKITIETLWMAGFDAVIVNPIMGPDALGSLISLVHRRQKGIITLCHMSAPESKSSYEMRVNLDNKAKKMNLYELFLDWAISKKSDGIIVGATFPTIIQFCKKKIKNRLDIFSPGIGTQGGDLINTLKSGSDFLIVGRTIINSKDPASVSKKLQSLSFFQ